ncbi:MAG: ribonuclease E/G, partial [Pseudomonadota bacterium]
KKSKRAYRQQLIERYKEARRKRAKLIRNYKIQEVVKRRQILLVQVVKEERGNKGAALTTYLSLAGRYCVLMPNTARGGGISRKIPNASDRKRLRRVVDSLDVAQGMGLIIRTAGAKRTKTEIKRDYDYLTRLWETIRSQTLESIAPCLIYEEASLIKRAIRDLYDKDISTVLVEGEDGYREAKDFMKMLMPSHAKNVQPYKDKLPLFVRYDVEKQLDAMYQPVVRLKSGGYIVINQTEALIAIDVNSGKATRERNIELTALKTNIEAAAETARQCRLRDLAGLIVIDFIDMEENKNNRTVEKKLKDALKHDRARIQVGRISNFGLLEMSRQRRRSGIVDGTTNACPTCNGAGAVRSSEMAALRILRAIESEAIAGRAGVISVRASLDVTLYVLNNKRTWLKRLEDDYALTIEVIADQSKAGDQYDIEKRGAARPQEA